MHRRLKIISSWTKRKTILMLVLFFSFALLLLATYRFTEITKKNISPSYIGITACLAMILITLYFFIKLAAETRKRNFRLESRAIKRAVELETVNKELEAFSYSVSHDLRAPLRAIIGYSLILQEDYGHQLNQEANKYISTVIESAKQMGQLIDDLLRFSQLSRLDKVEANIDMNGLVKSVITKMSVTQKLEKYVINIQPLPACRGDSSMLKQVWFNLIENAVKYSSNSQHPEIVIGCNETQTEYTYFIRDNGAGFDMAYKDKLFEVFHRLHRKDEFEGSGLGLSLVKRIIEKHKGTVYGESELNQGSTFYFTIPKYSL